MSRIEGQERPSSGERPPPRTLAARYDAIFLDLDGVIYRGDHVIDVVPRVLQRLREAGSNLLFLTNNSSRTPRQVADKLAGMGVDARPAEVLTSALATAAMLRREGFHDKRAFVIGEDGIKEALRAAGIRVLDGLADGPGDEHVDLVVVGWDRSVDYDTLRTASLLVQRGARLVATNPDTSYPAPDGLWPGAGAILAAVTATTGATPTVVGKPAKSMFESAIELTGARNPLVVGDRLDTDVAGASSMGLDSLLVFSGASRPFDLLLANELPIYVGHDVSALLKDVPPAMFRPPDPNEAGAIASLLARSGLSAEGVESRVPHTLVCEAAPHAHAPAASGKASPDPPVIAATVCVEPIGGFGLLRSLAVRADLRGRGLGELAVAAGVAMARHGGLSAIILFTETAAPFFRALGFRSLPWSELPGPVAASPQATEECTASASAMVFDLG